MNSNSLTHHGILGMKWGVRRYQNKDGTLTPLGKHHTLVSAPRPIPKIAKSDGYQEMPKPKGAIVNLVSGQKMSRKNASIDGYQEMPKPKGAIVNLVSDQKMSRKNASIDGYQEMPEPKGAITLKSKEQRESERQKRKDNRERGTLSDAELRKRIDRLKLEQELDKLTQSQVNQGRAYVEGILKDVGRRVLTTVISGGALYGIKVVLGGGFEQGRFSDAVFNGGPKKK